MPVTVRDLEVAQVLAREVREAAARSSQASLRADQVRLLFGAVALDDAERERIHAALEMVGLEAQPSLLEADADAPVAFVARNGHSTVPQPKQQRSRRRGSGSAGGARRFAREQERTEFPTVGEFARATLERARRRVADRNEGEGGEEPAADAMHEGGVDFDYDEPVPTADDEHLEASHEDGAEHHDDAPLVAIESENDDEPPAEPGDGGEHRDDAPVAVEPVEAEHESLNGHGPSVAVTAPEDEEEAHQRAAFEAEDDEHPPVASAAAYAVDEPGPAHGDEHIAEPPALHEAPVTPHEATAEGDERLGEVAAVLITAAALPVIGTSIAGWRFGLPYLALAIAASGSLVARARSEENSRTSVVHAIRSSFVARRAFALTAMLAIASAVAAVLISSIKTHTTASHPVTHATAPRVAKPAVTPRSTKPAPVPKTTPAPASPKRHQATPAPSTSGNAGGAPSAPATSGSSPSPSAGGGQSSGTQGLTELPPPGGSSR